MLKHLLSMICIFFLSLSVQAQWTVDSLSAPRKEMSIANVNGKIIFVGQHGSVGAGNSNAAFQRRVDIFDIESQTWSIENLSAVREKIYVAGSGNLAFFAGNSLFPTFNQNKADIYDTELKSWSSITFPTLSKVTTMSAYGDKVFFNDDKYVDIYDHKLQTWESHVLNSNTLHSIAVSCNGKVLFIGGGDPFEYDFRNTVDIYDVNTGTWNLENMSEAKGEVKAVCNNNKVYIVGGRTERNKYSKLIEIFDTESGSWLEPSSMQHPKRGFGLASTANAIYIAGGYHGEFFHAYSEVEIINGISGELTISNLSSVRTSLGAIGVGQNVYLAGGLGGEITKEVKTVDIYTEEETVSVQEANSQHFKIYPNPTHDEIYLINTHHSIYEKPITYQIFNQLGALILSGTYNGKIDTGMLRTGIYFLRYSGEFNGSEKFIKH